MPRQFLILQLFFFFNQLLALERLYSTHIPCGHHQQQSGPWGYEIMIQLITMTGALCQTPRSKSRSSNQRSVCGLKLPSPPPLLPLSLVFHQHLQKVPSQTAFRAGFYGQPEACTTSPISLHFFFLPALSGLSLYHLLASAERRHFYQKEKIFYIQ